MGCIASKKEIEDRSCPNIFQVMNVDEQGNLGNSSQLELTEQDLVLHRQGRPPMKFPLRTLRRYGFDAETFSFETGRRCPAGPGIYAFRCLRAEQLFNLVQSRILSRNNGDSDTTDASSNLVSNGPSRDSTYSELASLRRSITGSRFCSQNGVTTRLSSVGSTSGSVGPLSPQSITSAHSPLDSVPLIPPITAKRPPSQNTYTKEDMQGTATKDLEETNNNKTSTDSVSPTSVHSYLNSEILDLLPKENPTNINNIDLPMIDAEDSSVQDSNHLYMNIIPGTDKVVPLPINTSPPVKCVFDESDLSMSEAPDDSAPNYENFEIDPSFHKFSPNKDLNYIVLDLEPSGDSPKSPTASNPPDIPRRLSAGYAAIDFQKTVALSHSVNPIFGDDNDSCRKTRHSSVNHQPVQDGQSPSSSID